MIALVIVSVLTGLITALVFRRTTDMALLRATWKRIQAHLLEFRLFFDEPQLIWKAQLGLFREHARFFALLLPAMLILGPPMAWMWLQLDTIYAHRPLRAGEPAVVTAQLNAGASKLTLQAPAGMTVEVGPVRVAGSNQAAWRIRADREVRGTLKFTVDGQSVVKSIAAGGRPTLLSMRRTRDLTDFLLHPEEPRLPAGVIAWLDVDYPRSARIDSLDSLVRVGIHGQCVSRGALEKSGRLEFTVRWQSGRMRRSRKPLTLHGVREFESHPHRHNILLKSATYRF